MAPRGSAFEDQGRVKRIWAVIQPLSQLCPSRLMESSLQAFAVLEGYHSPAHHLEKMADLPEELIGDDRIEALAVVVHDPPDISYAMLPALIECLVHVAFVQFAVSGNCDHSPFLRAAVLPAFEPHVILHQAGKSRLGQPKPHRTSGKVDPVGIFRSGGIGLRPLVAAIPFELVERLFAEQILDRVKDRAGMWLYGNSIFRTQNLEIQCRHDSDRGS